MPCPYGFCTMLEAEGKTTSLRKEKGRPDQRGALSVYAATADLEQLILVEAQAGENRRAFRPDGVEGIRVKAEHFQDGRSHLSGLDKAVDGPMVDAGIR